MVKGIGLLATGDWTHPLWIREIKEKLVETGNGTLKLNPNFQFSNSKQFPLSKFENINSHFESLPSHPEFLLATEISSIYSQGGKVRRVHNLVWAPSLSAVDRIIAALLKRGCNLSADGRPIVGLSSIELSELIFEIDETCMIIPAHAWTPWFAMYGSKSGFDSIEECFGKYADKIYAIETGLSSDPAMNWRMDELKEKQIVSFGDAHSLQKLGREATVFELSGVSYENVRYALNQSLVFNRQKTGKLQSENKQKRSDNRIAYTIEFYPEEGKYHYTGHRDCKVSYSPNEARKKGVICPICGRKMTIGVMSRVEALAKSDIEVDSTLDRYKVRWIKQKMGRRPPFVMLVPLLEIIAESYGLGISAKKVEEFYETLISNSGSEFKILLETDLDDLKGVADFKVIEGIKKVRMGDIIIKPGYDGVFGTVKIWKEGKELKVGLNQESLF